MTFRRLLIATILSSLLITCIYGAPKKVIILTGDDLTHASGTHEFYAGGLLLKSSLENSNVKDKVACEVIHNWDGDVTALEGAAAIVHYYKGNKWHLMCDHHEEVDALAKSGVGQLFVHYGVDPCHETEASLTSWTGGVYKDKFSHNPFWTLKAQLENHPINNGVESYSVNDEWYMNIAFEGKVKTGYKRPDIIEQVYSVMHGEDKDFKKGKKIKGQFRKKEMSHEELTVMWAKERKDGGRGVGFTGAHFHKSWAVDELRKQILNAIIWTVKLPVPDEGVTSPSITEKMLNANLDARKRGGLKKIELTPLSSTAGDASGVIAAPAVNKKRKRKKKSGYDQTLSELNVKGLHPYFALENLDTLGTDELKIGGMHFEGEDLYVVTLSPDRTNKAPDHEGKVILVSGVTKADGKTSQIKTKTLVTGLYEPTAITVVGESLYVGTKTQILRFEDFKNREQKAKDGTVILDGLSTINFHTYTVGFEKLIKNGKTYLSGNFTTAILLGGKRGYMVPPNPEVKRGSTFVIGPVTGKESPQDVKVEYLAGGFRTPNGFELGPDNVAYVADNQGVFNPSNEFFRIEPGSFYGHYLLDDEGKGRASAFQPTNIPAMKGSAVGQKPATVHLPQSVIARSPAQPHVIHGRTGVLAPYNGQVLLCDFTTGSMLRVFTEEVDGTWQGVAFKHSGGLPDKEGNGGFTGGPNRIELGPDGHYYIGQVGAGRLWEYNGRKHGLQRFRVKSAAEVDPKFNEILAVRVIDGGFELEFLKPLDSQAINKDAISISQWTYIPTNRYGGAPVGTESLSLKGLIFDETGKKAKLLIDGLKDAQKRYVLKDGAYTSDNTGYVVHISLDANKTGKLPLYAPEFWYTLHKKIGGEDLATNKVTGPSPRELAKIKYTSLCVSCHVARGNVWAAPDLRGLLGRKQTVVKRDGRQVDVIVDRNYIVNAIIDPESEKVVEYKDAVMAQMGIEKKEASELVDYIITLK